MKPGKHSHSRVKRKRLQKVLLRIARRQLANIRANARPWADSLGYEKYVTPYLIEQANRFLEYASKYSSQQSLYHANEILAIIEARQGANE